MRRELSLLATLLFGLTFAAGAATGPDWDKVPARDHTRINPLKGNPEAAEGGRGIYKDHCAQCHGANAMGDGKRAPALNEIKNATDGDLEWFLRQGELGRGMPSWSSLPQAQRWQLVVFLRSLSKPN